MGDFSAFSDGKTIKGLGLTSRAEAVTLAAARQVPSFRLPVKLHDMWAGLEGTPPETRHITAKWLGAELLPAMFILDVVDAGQDFRWRVFGTDHTVRYGAEATGMLVSDAAKRDTSARDSLKFAREVYATGTPTFYLTDFFDRERPVKQSSTVILPLADASGATVRLFGCASWS